MIVEFTQPNENARFPGACDTFSYRNTTGSAVAFESTAGVWNKTNIANWLPLNRNNAGVTVVASPDTNDVAFRLPTGIWDIVFFGDIDPATGVLAFPLNLSADGVFATAIQVGLKYRLANTTGSFSVLDSPGPVTTGGAVAGNGWAAVADTSENSTWNYGVRFQVPANTSYDVGFASSKSVEPGGTAGDLTLRVGSRVSISFAQAFGVDSEDTYVASTSLSRGTIGTQVASIAEQLARLQDEREKIEKLVGDVESKYARLRVNTDGKEEKKERDDDIVMLPTDMYSPRLSTPGAAAGGAPFSLRDKAAVLAPKKSSSDKGRGK